MGAEMIIAVGLILVIVLFATGAPIWAGLTLGSTVMLLMLHLNSMLIPVTLLNSVDTFTLLACPFFIIAGNIMAKGNLSPHLFNFVNTFTGRIRGGAAFTTILVCVIYGAITGSASATLAGAAAICVPNMIEAGYSRRFCAGLLAACAPLGTLIPPSVIMIIYGSMVNENTGKLFLAGILPGLLCAAGIGVVAFLKSPQLEEMKAPQDPAYFSWRNRGVTFVKSFPALLMPLIILGSIYKGIATPTEAATVACVYGVFICFFVYRSMTLPGLLSALTEAAATNAMMFTLIAASSLVALPLTILQIPQQISSFVADSGLSGVSLLLGITAVYLILGCFLEAAPVVILVVPIVYPTLLANGISLIHFNVITVISMMLGQITPPFGMSLYLSSRMVGCDIFDVVKEVWPYMIALALVLILVIFVQPISLLVPNLMG